MSVDSRVQLLAARIRDQFNTVGVAVGLRLPKLYRPATGTSTHVRDVANFHSQTSAPAAILILDTGMVAGSTQMMKLTFTGYNYATTNHNIDFDVAFYWYGTQQIVQSEVSNRGTLPLTAVRLMKRDVDNTLSIAVEPTQAWSYPKGFIEAQGGHGNASDSIFDGWATKFAADLTGYTVINNPPIVTGVLTNDPRLSDSRTPTTHSHTYTDIPVSGAPALAEAQAGTATIERAWTAQRVKDAILANTPADLVSSVAGRTGAVVLAKADVGLGSVDNTADTAKPVSTAQQTALNGKANTVHGHALTDANITGILPIAQVPAAVFSTTHLPEITEVNALTAALAGKAATSHQHLLADLPEAWIKQAARAATTVNITLSAPQTIDTVAVVAGDRVLVKNQTTTAQNGIYIVAAGAWTRAPDCDTTSKMAGGTVSVDQGGQAATIWSNNFPTTGTIGTTGMTWAKLLDTSGLFDTTVPAALGTAAAGSALTAARRDHVHAMPSAAQVGAAPTVHGHALTDANITGVLPVAQLPTHSHTYTDIPVSAAPALAEAQAGTAVVERAWTAQRVKDAITALAPVTTVAGRAGAVVLTKTDVGLASVDNTADTAKPVSTAQQTALNGKANTIHSHTYTDLPISAAPTQLQAETGTDTVERAWTAQRDRQAVTAYAYSKAQVDAQVLAATSAGPASGPGTQLHRNTRTTNYGYASALANFNATTGTPIIPGLGFTVVGDNTWFQIDLQVTCSSTVANNVFGLWLICNGSMTVAPGGVSGSWAIPLANRSGTGRITLNFYAATGTNYAWTCGMASVVSSTLTASGTALAPMWMTGTRL